MSVDETSKESAEGGGESMKLNFMPFQVRERMILAPLVRFQLSRDQKERLEELIKAGQKTSVELYVEVLKSGSYKPKSMKRTWPAEDKEDDVVVVGKLGKFKLFKIADFLTFQMSCKELARTSKSTKLS